MSVGAPPPIAPSPFRRDYWANVAEALYLKQIVAFVGANLTLVGVLLYAYVSSVGILYCEALYYWIGINPLQFFDASDFLLAGLRHPFALIAPALYALSYIAFAVIGGTLWAFTSWLGSRAPDNFAIRLLRTFRPVSLRFSLFYALFIFVFVALAVPLGTAFFAQSCGSPVTIQLHADASAGQTTDTPLHMIIVGSTQKVLLLRAPDNNRFMALPYDSISQISAGKDETRDVGNALFCIALQ
jgi:hypothetical protein